MFKHSLRVLAVLLILAAIAIAFIVTPVVSSHADSISTPSPSIFWSGH